MLEQRNLSENSIAFILTSTAMTLSDDPKTAPPLFSIVDDRKPRVIPTQKGCGAHPRTLSHDQHRHTLAERLQNYGISQKPRPISGDCGAHARSLILYRVHPDQCRNALADRFRHYGISLKHHGLWQAACDPETQAVGFTRQQYCFHLTQYRNALAESLASLSTNVPCGSLHAMSALTPWSSRESFIAITPICIVISLLNGFQIMAPPLSANLGGSKLRAILTRKL
jgi:hypothetical protein